MNEAEKDKFAASLVKRIRMLPLNIQSHILRRAQLLVKQKMVAKEIDEEISKKYEL